MFKKKNMLDDFVVFTRVDDLLFAKDESGKNFIFHSGEKCFKECTEGQEKILFNASYNPEEYDIWTCDRKEAEKFIKS